MYVENYKSEKKEKKDKKEIESEPFNDI